MRTTRRVYRRSVADPLGLPVGIDELRGQKLAEVGAAPPWRPASAAGQRVVDFGAEQHHEEVGGGGGAEPPPEAARLSCHEVHRFPIGGDAALFGDADDGFGVAGCAVHGDDQWTDPFEDADPVADENLEATGLASRRRARSMVSSMTCRLRGTLLSERTHDRVLITVAQAGIGITTSSGCPPWRTTDEEERHVCDQDRPAPRLTCRGCLDTREHVRAVLRLRADPRQRQSLLDRAATFGPRVWAFGGGTRYGSVGRP